ncbi:MAG TPA: response regulator [Bryobacteraceae bacterium]|nr:response regulator [Bryobacteraceae bacterium]
MADKINKFMPRAITQRILIVDDENQDVALFRRILERAGYSVTDCNSGKLAIRAIEESAFDLVIFDPATFCTSLLQH